MSAHVLERVSRRYNLNEIGSNIIGNFVQPGSAKDPFYSSVSLLLHLNGTNGSQTITDNSPNALSMTISGTDTLDTSKFEFGGSSFHQTGGNSYITTVGNHALFNFGTSDFTIESWINTTTNAGGSAVGHDNNGGGGWRFVVSSHVLFFEGNNGATNEDLTGTTAVDDGNWHWIVIERSGGGANNLVLWVDGNRDAMISSTNNWDQSTTNLGIGYRNWNNSNPFGPGWIDEIRITKGVARYPIANSTISTQSTEFPNS